MGAEGCVELRVTEPVAETATADLRRRLERALSDRKHVVVNLYACPVLDADAIGMLVAMDSRFAGAGLDLKLFAARGSVRETLYLAGDLDA